ncbi:MAG: hydrogenase maturation protease [Deltaproteobacteria bacterium]|nr:hydrogenase maturation protease [Deltaproteobacteria bacterium]
MTTRLIRIIGIGNPLMGDDGIGISVIERLQKEPLPASVELVDGGCGGLTLLQLFDGCGRLIIIDAADFGAPVGSIKTLDNHELDQLPAALPHQASHNFGLAEALHTAEKLGSLPPLTLFLLQVAACRPQLGLSNPVEKALPGLIKTLRQIIDRPDR